MWKERESLAADVRKSWLATGKRKGAGLSISRPTTFFITRRVASRHSS